MLDLNKALLVLLLSLSQPAIGQQVYESTDAEGNVSFSDQPSEGAETVDIPTTNVGDSVKVPPPSTDPSAGDSANTGNSTTVPATAPDSGNQQNWENQQNDEPPVDYLPENEQGDIDRVERRQNHHYNYLGHPEARGGR
jgi:hypothetical protein